MVGGKPRPARPFPASPALLALVEQLWPATEGLRVGSGREQWPGRFREIERYAAVPSLASARFLLPVTSPAAAAAAARSYNQLRPAVTRVSRRVAAAAAGVARMRLAQLVVGRDVETAPSEQPVTQAVRRLVGDSVGIGIGVRAPNPNHKPTLQLFGADGTPAGFAKVSWNSSTAEQVKVETQALARVPAHLQRLRTPQLIGSGGSGDRRFSVVTPLPLSVRRWPDSSEPPELAFTRDVLSTSPEAIPTVRQSLQVERLRRDCASSVWAADLRAVFLDCLDKFVSRYGDLPIATGAWHGDWVPWNVALDGPDLYAWDWEHYGADVAAGLDVLHWHFQVSFVARRKPLLSSFRHAHDAAAPAVRALQPSPAASAICSTLYALEMTARQQRMQRGGGGWDVRYYPDVVTVLPALQREWIGTP